MRNRVKLRRAGVEDAPAILLLVAQLGYPVREDALRRTLARLCEAPDHAVIVAEADGGICGLLVLSSRPSLTLQGSVGVVQELVVRSELRRREIGESLLQYAKGLAVERGFARLECPVPSGHRPAAEDFLMERGFEIAGSTIYRWAVLEDKNPRLPADVRARPVPA